MQKRQLSPSLRAVPGTARLQAELSTGPHPMSHHSWMPMKPCWVQWPISTVPPKTEIPHAILGDSSPIQYNLSQSADPEGRVERSR